MNASQSSHDPLLTIIQWGTTHHSVRAMLLTSTRAVPNAPIDAYPTMTSF